MKKKKDLPKVEPVKIKPLFGIKPSIWVPSCYALAIILLIFVICFLPGIRHGFKRVTFISKARNAAVFVDGEYVGGTPFTTNIASGTHSARFVVSETVIDNIEFKVGHPVFLTWLFPRKMQVESNATINSDIYIPLTKSFLEDIANYSAILSYDNVYNYPPLFTEYANTISGIANLSETDYQDVLKCALAFVTTQQMLTDAENALKILSVDIDISDLKQAVQNKEYKIETERLIGLSRVFSSTLECEYFNRGGISVNGFTFDDYPVSEAMYYYFVKNNPQWAQSEKNALIEKGLVDEYYLEGVTLSSLNTTKPIRNISYFAAQAFCQWLSDISGKSVFIPEELQWTTAANFSDSEYQKSIIPKQSNSGPSGVLGSVWELTSTPYVPMLKLFDYSVYDILEKYEVKAEVIIKGGSYVSDESNITTYSIGTAPLDLCSDYMGFRIAWR